MTNPCFSISVILAMDSRVNHDHPDEHDRNRWFEDGRILDDVRNKVLSL